MIVMVIGSKIVFHLYAPSCSMPHPVTAICYVKYGYVLKFKMFYTSIAKSVR